MVKLGMSWFVFFGFLLGGVASLLSAWLIAVRVLERPGQPGAEPKGSSWRLGLSFAAAIALSAAAVVSLLAAGEAPDVFRHGFAMGFWAAGLWGLFLSNLLASRGTKRKVLSVEDSR